MAPDNIFSTIFCFCLDTRDEPDDNFHLFFVCCPGTPKEPVDIYIFPTIFVAVQGQGPGSLRSPALSHTAGTL